MPAIEITSEGKKILLSLLMRDLIDAATQLFGHFILFVWGHEEIKKYMDA
jgi:hypothetical protein